MPDGSGSKPRREASSTQTRTFSAQPRTTCTGQLIDCEAVVGAKRAVADGSQVFEDEVLAGAKRADNPPEEMPKRNSHGKNIIGTIRIQLCF